MAVTQADDDFTPDFMVFCRIAVRCTGIEFLICSAA